MQIEFFLYSAQMLRQFGITVKTILSDICGGKVCWILQFSGYHNVMPNVYLSASGTHRGSAVSLSLI